MNYQRILDALLLFFALFLLQQYLQWNALNFLLAIPAIWIFFKQRSNRQYTMNPIAYSFLLIGLLGLLLLTIRMPVQTLFYLALVFYFMIRGYEEGKSGISLLFFVALLMSPLAEYFFRVFSFPLRLWITSKAVSVLKSFGEPVKAIGNVIDVSGKEFSVDMACMGLNLTTASLLFALLLLLLMQTKSHLKLGLFWTITFLFSVFILNVLANLIRIVVLVKFQIVPENWMHEIIGLVSLLVYVCIPSWWIALKLVCRFGRVVEEPKTQKTANSYWMNAMHLKFVFYVLFFIAGERVLQHKEAVKPFQQAVASATAVAGYELKNYSTDVIKLTAKDQLVYVKRIPDFFTPEHSPMICWQGSGYQLQKISETQLTGFRCYTAELVQGEQKLYTAWWFDSGNHRTNMQFDWRWNSFRTGTPYSLVNCTVSKKERLNSSIHTLLASKGFRNLLQQP